MLNYHFLSGQSWHIHAHRCTAEDSHKIDTWCCCFPAAIGLQCLSYYYYCMHNEFDWQLTASIKAEMSLELIDSRITWHDTHWYLHFACLMPLIMIILDCDTKHDFFLLSHGDGNHPNPSIYIRAPRDESRSLLFASNHARFTVLLLRLTHIVRLLGSPTAPPPLSPWHFVLLLDYGWTARVRVLFLLPRSCSCGTPPCYFWPRVFFQRKREVLCSVRGGASSGRLPAEFLTCHSNLPALLLSRFRFALVCVWIVSIASVPSRAVRTAHLVCFQSYLGIQMCTPGFRSLARRRTLFSRFFTYGFLA